MSVRLEINDEIDGLYDKGIINTYIELMQEFENNKELYWDGDIFDTCLYNPKYNFYSLMTFNNKETNSGVEMTIYDLELAVKEVLDIIESLEEI